jgi:hypothetical protein
VNRHHARRTLAAAAAFLLALTACSGGDDDTADDPTDGQVSTDDGSTDDDGTDDDSSDPEPLDDDGTADDDGADEPAPDPDDADTGTDDGTTSAPPLGTESSTDDRDQEPEGLPNLWLTDVRVGVHDGFDRVVFELDGDGTIGWFTTSDDQASEQGSGAPIDVAGDAVIDVALRGILIPPDRPTGTVAFEEDRVAAPAGAQVLTEVVVGIIFEGQQQVVIGLDEQVPYRIARFDDPQRVVIDLVHP